MRYVDAFILPIAKERMNEYQEIVEKVAAIWKEHGALEYFECVGDDLGTEKGVRSLTEMTGAADDENVILGWVIFESKESREHVNKKVASDPRMAKILDLDTPLFDHLRMGYGGFEALVHVI